MKQILAFVLLSAILFSACTARNEALSMSLTEIDFSSVTQIKIQNAHNGKWTYITEPEEVGEICAFLHQVSGKEGHSAKGYYEGTYSLTLLNGEEKVFSIGFGDSDSFFCGEFGDGYPVRYLLDGMGIEEVTGFLKQYTVG